MGPVKPRIVKKVKRSKREIITYITLFCNVAFAVFSLLIKIPPLEIATLLAAIDVPVMWYLQKETERKSEDG